MIRQLSKWNGRVDINGTNYDDVTQIPSTLTLDNTTVITLIPRQVITPVSGGKVEHCITVKQYMTEPASPEFDFMDKWNKGIPMPMRTMVGTVEKETRGMVYMKLHGLGKPTVFCTRCGRSLTNPVSRYYGLGIECIKKVGINRDIEDIEGIKEDLVKITWEGWIIKSAITEDKIEEADNG